MAGFFSHRLSQQMFSFFLCYKDSRWKVPLNNVIGDVKGLSWKHEYADVDAARAQNVTRRRSPLRKNRSVIWKRFLFSYSHSELIIRKKSKGEGCYFFLLRYIDMCMLGNGRKES
ncbi:unnamed protein product [Lactuca virosa]|uniref:Uncharacterized protein n=1 Tax=Lactuca virosa TaxID=75947 RepID=A0AAU9PBK8_9ASTR|nr:unnamed protein product [Lactuca virosa]